MKFVAKNRRRVVQLQQLGLLPTVGTSPLPRIRHQPESISGPAESTITLSITATAPQFPNRYLIYRWYFSKNGFFKKATLLTGENSILPVIVSSATTGTYWCEVSAGIRSSKIPEKSVLSAAARVSIGPASSTPFEIKDDTTGQEFVLDVDNGILGIKAV
jgi:hypothetical protein